MNGQLFQARSRDNLQLDMVRCHRSALRSEVAAIRTARATAANRIHNPHRSLVHVAASWLTSTCTRGPALRPAPPQHSLGIR